MVFFSPEAEPADRMQGDLSQDPGGHLLASLFATMLVLITNQWSNCHD